jgi:gliding motility-associated-like protein
VYIYDGPQKHCFITDTVYVEERPTFDVDVPVTYACLNDTVFLPIKVTPGNVPFDIRWMDLGGGGPTNFISGHNSLTPTVAAQKDMDYVVTIIASDTTYCESIDTVHFRLHPLVGLEAGPDEIIRYGSSIQLRAKGNGHFTWTPADYLSNVHISDPTASPMEDIVYYVTVKTDEGCEETDSLKIFITNGSLPSAFTPNGDGKNDLLKLLRPNELTKLQEFRIYDRWGNQVFYTQDVNEGWDGRFKGVPADLGVYFYSLKYNIGHKTYHDKGDVSLVR